MKKKTNFSNDLKNFMRSNYKNNYTDNLPVYLQHSVNIRLSSRLYYYLLEFVKRLFFGYHVFFKVALQLEKVYSLLDKNSKSTFIEVIGYKLMGYRKVKMYIIN